MRLKVNNKDDFQLKIVAKQISSLVFLSSLYFYKVVQTELYIDNWENIFIDTGTSVASPKVYMQTFVNEKLIKPVHAGPSKAQGARYIDHR